MKIKRLLAMLLAAIMMVSAMAIPASAANTTDSKFEYHWGTTNHPSRFDFTPTRKKFDATPVYIVTIDDSLPYGGYYAATYYGTSSTNATNKASADEYWIGNYTAYTIRANGTNVSQVGKQVRIRGHYSNTTYSWGDCTINWSPDTTNPRNYTSLN